MAIDHRRLSDAEAVRLVEAVEQLAARQAAPSRRTSALLAGANQVADDAHWFVLRVAPHAEKAVDKALHDKGIERWLPVEKIVPKRRGGMGKVKREAVAVPVWPGYLFARVAATKEAFAGLFGIDGVVALLGGESRPSPVKHGVILKLKLFLEHDGTAREVLSKALKAGDRVRVDDGPFASFEGMVTWLDARCRSERVKVDVEIFGRSVPVDLELAQVSRID